MSLWSDLVTQHSYKSLNQEGFCIGIPTVNRKDFLTESLADIAHNLNEFKLEKLVIVDNGNQDIPSIIPPELTSRTKVFTENKNLGVAGSWNKLMNDCFSTCSSDFVALVNDDIVLGKDCLVSIEESIEKYPKSFIINGGYFWSCFAISRKCWETVGKFDDNFFPAYFEDNDYHRRLNLYAEHYKIPDLYRTCHGMVPAIKRNSASITKDRSLNNGYHKNAAYYQDKWGGNVRYPRFATPFNQGGTEP